MSTSEIRRPTSLSLDSGSENVGDKYSLGKTYSDIDGLNGVHSLEGMRLHEVMFLVTWQFQFKV